MKKTLLTATSILFLAACGNSIDDASPQEKQVPETKVVTLGNAEDSTVATAGNHATVAAMPVSYQKGNAKFKEADISQLPEYPILEANINLAENKIFILEDSPYKRVLLAKNQQGEPTYKSILVKNTKRLKIVDYNGGLVYNAILN